MNKIKSSEIKNSLITLWNGRSSAVEG